MSAVSNYYKALAQRLLIQPGFVGTRDFWATVGALYEPGVESKLALLPMFGSLDLSPLDIRVQLDSGEDAAPDLVVVEFEVLPDGNLDTYISYDFYDSEKNDYQSPGRRPLWVYGELRDITNKVNDFPWKLVIWVLQNPDLMEKKLRDMRSKAEIRQRNKRQPDRPRTVTIVDLRAAHREAAAEVAAAERTYRSRWIVRGHWHRFWTGPRDGERKLEKRYVMPYVKGPADAPLNVTVKVSKW